MRAVLLNPLGTSNDALGPQATPAGRKGIAKAIFFIRLSHVADSAGSAEGEFKSLDPAAKSRVLRFIP